MNETSAAQLVPVLTILDVGARGGLDPVWAPLLPHLRAYAFDADPEECARLQSEHGSPQLQFVPLVLGAAPGSTLLHRTTDPACSSLYPPNELVAATFRALDVIMPTGSYWVEIDTLDRWADREGVENVSFIKLDIQGSELDVLRGAKNVLSTVQALRVEVEFNPIYRGQPLFGDVDAFLRRNGFVLWRLTNLCHYVATEHKESFVDQQVFAATPSDVVRVDFAAAPGRLFWAEAFFVRAALADGIPPADADTAARAALVASVLGFPDLAAIASYRT